jgi:hypothetical protein
MKNLSRQASAKKTASNRLMREAGVDYTITITARAVYRKGRFELQKPVVGLQENEAVELVIQRERSIDRKQQAIEILRDAKLRAIEEAQSMTLEEARAAFDQASAALQKELRKK